MKEKLNRIIAGSLIPAILMPSCTSDYYWDDDVVTINTALTTKSSDFFNSIAVPMNLNLDSEDQKFLAFVVKLVSDIINNPLIAKKVANDPSSISKMYGVDDIEINFDDELWKLILALGDTELHDAIKTNDVSRFLKLCDKKGLLSELQKSEILKYQDLATSVDAEIRPMCATLVFIAAVSVMMFAAAGCAGVSAAALYYTETYWNGTESSATMIKRDRQAYQLWVIKQGQENSYVMLSEYQEKLVNECINSLYEYFPDKMVDVDTGKLRQFISLNLPKK